MPRNVLTRKSCGLATDTGKQLLTSLQPSSMHEYEPSCKRILLVCGIKISYRSVLSAHGNSRLSKTIYMYLLIKKSFITSVVENISQDSWKKNFLLSHKTFSSTEIALEYGEQSIIKCIQLFLKITKLLNKTLHLDIYSN